MNIPKEKNETTFETVHTAHYTFTIEKKLRKTMDGIPINWHYLVGSHIKPCLSLYIPTENYSKLIQKKADAAKLINLKALDTCIENEVSDETFEKYSFGKELLNMILDILKKDFKYIRHLELSDDSHIPCNRELLDEVDLLTYSIAHYGKTWYEQNYNAYLVPKEKMETYRTQVANYMSEEFKAKYDWNTFLNTHVGECTEDAYTMIKAKYYEWEDLFNKTKTFPEFFLAIRNQIPRQKKCMFYRDWLQRFIYSCIRIEREWVIDIPKKKGGRRRVRTRRIK